LKKLMRLFFISAVFCLLAGACIAAEPIQITVSIPPQKYFVEKIGGSRVRITVMAPAGGCAETYEPKPQQMTALSQSRIYFAIGFPFEDVWLPRFAAANPRLLICRTDEGIKKLAMDAHRGHEHGDKKDKMLDPHIWLSPPLARVQAKNILKALQSADAASSGTYQRNFEIFVAELAKLDATIRESFKGVKKGSVFLAMHPSWQYFAEEYGLKQMVIEIEGREPKPKEMMEIIQTAKEHRIKIIYTPPQTSLRTVETVAKALDARVAVIDHLSEDWEKTLLLFRDSIVQSSKQSAE